MNKQIDNLIFEIDTELIKARKRIPTPAIIVTIAGIVLIIIGKMLGNAESESSPSYIIETMGYLIAASGFIFAIVGLFRKGIPFYVPTGEKLIRTELTFDNTQRSDVIKYVLEGDLTLLTNLEKKESSAITAIIYRNSNKDALLLQAFEYIPHSYHPITEVHFFKEGKSTKAQN